VARVDVKNKLIQAKIVYYGPGLCGKTTNLEYIAKKMFAGQELMSVATEGDRTIFFDFLPLELGKFRGSDVHFKLYTVPGQIRYDETRRMVLKNVDGVVFVADSQEQMLDSNLESLQNLYDNLKQLGIDESSVGIILQYNKRDLPGVLPVDILDSALNRRRYPTFLASAKTGEGVFETVKAACAEVLKVLAANASGGPMRVAAPASQGLMRAAAPASQGVMRAAAPASQGLMRAAVPAPQGVTKAAVQAPQGVTQAAEPASQVAMKAAAPVEPMAQPAAAPPAAAAAKPAHESGATQTAVGKPAARSPSPTTDKSPSPRAPEAALAPLAAKPASTADDKAAAAAAAKDQNGPVHAGGTMPVDTVHDAASALKVLIEPLATKDHLGTLVRRLEDLTTTVRSAAPSAKELLEKLTQLSSSHEAGVGALTAAVGRLSKGAETPKDLPDKIAELFASHKAGIDALSAVVGQLARSVAAVRSENVENVRSLQAALAALQSSQAGVARTTEPSDVPKHLATKDDVAALAQRLDDLAAAVKSPATTESEGRGELAQLVASKEDVRALREAVAELREEVAKGAKSEGDGESRPPSKDVSALHEAVAELRKDVAQLAASHGGSLEAMATRIGQLSAPAPAEVLDRAATKDDLAAIGQQLTAARGESESGQRAISEILTAMKGLESAVAAMSRAERPSATEWVQRVATREDLAAFEQRIAHRLERTAVEAAREQTAHPAQAPAVAPEVAPKLEVEASAKAEPAAKVESRRPAPRVESQRPAPAPQPTQSAPPAPPEASPVLPSKPPEQAAPSAPPATAAESTGDVAVAAPPATETAPAEVEQPHVAAESTAEAAPAPPPPQPEPEEAAAPAPKIDLTAPPHVNAARVARVMVADLFLYNKEAVESSILQGDFFERNKDALADMRATYESRVPQDVRAEFDHLERSINDFIASKRAQLSAR
jgi:signal recognition particle receptor subunit beta